jgi:hypothetical protein
MKIAPRPLIASLLTVAAVVGSAPAAAQEINDNFWVEAQAYWPKVDTNLEVSSLTNNTVGTDIDFEKDLNYDNSKTLPAFSAGARITNSIRADAEYYTLGRKSSSTLARNIEFDDVMYAVGADVSSKFDSSIYRFTLGYSFYRKPGVEIGASLGLHATDFVITIDGTGSVNGATATIESRRKKVLAPLPTLGLYSDYEVAPRFVLGGNVDWLKLKLGDYDGRLLNFEAQESYRAFKNIALGVMYRSVNYRVNVTKPEWTGSLRYKFHGPAVFVQAGF